MDVSTVKNSCYTPTAGRVASVSCPRELKVVLLDLYLCYLEQKPSNILDFCLTYFENMKKLCGESKLSILGPDIGNIDHVEKTQDYFRKRRNAVSLESYEPEIFVEPREEQKMKKSDRKEVINALGEIEFFKDVDMSGLKLLATFAVLIKVQADEVIFEEGDQADHFYLVNIGHFVSYKTQHNMTHVIHKYNSGGCFGLEALYQETPREMSVMSTTKGNLWAFDKRAVKRVVLDAESAKYFDRKVCVETSAMFSSLSEQDRSILIEMMELRVFKMDEFIFREGDYADGMYLIVQGEVDIYVAANGKGVLVETIDTGYFGEMSLIGPSIRLMRAIARKKVQALFLSARKINDLLPHCMEPIKDYILRTDNIRQKKYQKIYESDDEDKI